MVRELDLIEHFRDLSLVCEVTIASVRLGMLKLTSGFLDEIRKGQTKDVTLVDQLSLDNQIAHADFRLDDNGVLRF